MAEQVAACFLLVLFTIGVSGMDDDMAELAKMVRETCHEETGVDLALIDQVNNGADLMPDAKLKCYIKCTMETAGVLTDGVVDVDTLLALLPDQLRDRTEDKMRSCGTQKGGDDCETAFLTQVCWQKGNKADYFLI